MKNILLYVTIFLFSINFASAKKKVVVFEDNISTLKIVEGECHLGNFTAYSLKGDGSQEPNKKWLKAWGVWNCNDVLDSRSKCYNFVCARTHNDDWLVSNEIDLDGVLKPSLDLDYYSRYGTDNANNFEILVSTDFKGDVTTAKWTKLPFTVYHKLKKSESQSISLKKFTGKKVVIAFHVFGSDKENELKNMTRNYFISKVQVAGKK